jgi:ribokinase
MDMRLILNPAPAKEIPDELIALADFIIPNETELTLLTGQPVSDVPSAESAARKLLERGAGNVIVTMGSNGALIVNRELSKQVDTYKVEVVDTTAAGDAFIGGFSIALLNDKPLEEAVRYACACGALAVTKFGAQPSLPTKEEVEKLLS